MKSVVIIGAGAAGCFCAIELKRRHPDFDIRILEAGSKPLAKVAITGGGRCNLTNSFADVQRLRDVYPRGEQLMKRALRVFSNEDTMEWFESEGVRLVVQEDQCVFPASQDAMQIVRTLENLLRRLGVEIICNARVTSITRGKGFQIETSKGSFGADAVVVCSGGGASAFLNDLPIEIVKPVPSLFTLKLKDEGMRRLMGTVVENATLSLAGTPFKSHGTLLLTDWGISGPATLKLSSYAARFLSENSYTGTVLINYLDATQDRARELLLEIGRKAPQKQVGSTSPEGITSRLWKHLLSKAGLREDIKWAEMGSKGMNRLAAALTEDACEIAGRCHFKEEFVTCGGVSLQGINLSTLEHKEVPGLHFAGEALDLDAVTGGFNLQAAWSTAMVVARSM